MKIVRFFCLILNSKQLKMMDRITLKILNDLNQDKKREIYHTGNITIFDHKDYYSESLTLKGKVFKCNKLIFEHFSKPEFNVRFEDCIFDCEVEFDNCSFDSLIFISCEIKSREFVVLNSDLNSLEFRENTNDIHNVKTTLIKDGTIEIEGGNIKFINIENTHFKKGKLTIKNLESIENCSIIRSTLNYITISHCNFKSHFEYFGNKTASKLDSAFFNHCIFNHSSFFESTFNSDTHFADCVFLNISKFESTGDEIKTILRFDDCEFLKQVSFNKSRIHKISFNNLKFYDIISLQETYFDIVDMDRTVFDKQANFDDIQIKQIYNCNRRTIRTIKLQLQKAENKIDYNKFRVYEFNAYRKDIKKKLKEFEKDKDHLNHRVREPIQLKRDDFVLWISDIVSEYGTDWKRAMIFTFLSGLAAFSLFFTLENLKLNVDLKNWEDFLYGYFRFFLITDFKNEYYETGESVLKFNCFISLIPFIIGKIAVAFGLYEMIQSFRKFKA